MGDLKLALTLTADGKQLIGTVKGADRVVSDLNTRLNRTAPAGNKAAQGLAKVQRQGDAAGKSLKRMGSYAVGAFAGLSAINLGQKITQDLAAFQDIRTRLQSLSGTTAAYAANEEYLMQITRAHHKELIPLADNYAALLNLQDSGLLTQIQARTILEGMSNAQSALGASSNQLGQSMYGLSQALASPIVRAEELNQLVEPMPGLLNKMDRAAGLPAGGFRQMVLDGKVTADFLRNNLIKALGEYDGAAAATASNISAQSRDMKNAYQQLIVAFETPINSSLTPVLSTLTEGLMWSTDNAELLMDVLGGALVIAMSRTSAAAVSGATASLSKARADGVARAAAISGAQAELQKAMAQRKGVLTSGQAVVADTRLTAARAALTAATNRATFATRAMNGAMSLAGGPVGVVMMAAAGIAYFAMQADEAKEPVLNLAEEVAKLNGQFKALSQQERQIKISKLSTQMKAWRSELIKTNAEMERVNGHALLLRGTPGELQSHVKLDVLKTKASELTDKLTEASATQKALFDQGLPNIDKQPTTIKNKKPVDKAQQQLLDRLTKQKQLYGEVSEAAKVRYEIEYGSLKKLDPAINAQILLEAKALDAKKKAAVGTKEAADAVKEQEKQLKSLLAVLDPLTAASNEVADKERLLKIYFEQTNVPLEKRRALLAALKEEYAAPQETSEFDQLRGNLDPTFSENQNYSENLGILNDELQNTPGSEALKRNQINLLIEAEQQRHAMAMSEINGGVSTQFDAMWSESFDRFAAGIGSATADALFESKNFGDAMMSIGKGALKSVVAGLVEISVKKLAMAAIEQSIMTTSAATATTTAAATGASITASMAPAAVTASIATMGGAPSFGMMAMMAAMALIPSIIGQFHGGGTIPREGTYLLDGGETVYTRNQQQTLMNAMTASSSPNKGGRNVSIEQHNTIVVNNQRDVDTLEQVLPELVALTKSAVVDDLNQRGDVWQAGG
ncbi:tape measure protein [Shewanella sp. D64]|uniref:tape measure protein n=1 Tax=unclassified Shewanella TaxID=196818 RepID=UPI0022BA7258|nr:MULTISPECIES: tape measure protein [unclassified Shewanella]MEC4724515.1 tape measure protein [Shewanella sp. D64]MEC4736708.1 tape measure protein [Shewanella sp. E94]WBJ94623.1 tape measure protein [Shewanella sp. MTB7]